MATKRQSYYATLRAVQEFSRRSDVSYGEAQQVWRALRDWLGRSPFGVEVERHWRKVSDFIDDIRRRHSPPPPPEPPEKAEPQEYEITWQYKASDGKSHHITVRAIGPDATNEQVRRVFWRALNGGTLDYWRLSAVNWTWAAKSGRGGGDKEYRVTELATPEFRNLWNHARPRVARVEA